VKFHEIYEIVNKTLLAHNNDLDVTIKKIVDADLWAREYVRRNFR
jgi:1-deoxy-D-xylulose 5-phosphate reductoisomerase